MANSASEEDRRNYTEILDRLRQARDARDQSLKLAAAAQGVERARHLDQALSALKSLPPYVVMADYADLISQIFAIDPDNRALLKAKYARYADVAWKARHDEALEALRAARLARRRRTMRRDPRRAQAHRAVSPGNAGQPCPGPEGAGQNADAEAEFALAIELGRKAVDERRAAFDAAPGDVDRRTGPQ